LHDTQESKQKDDKMDGDLLRSYILSLEEYENIDELCKILNPFKLASEILEGSIYPTLSMVLPIIKRLQDLLKAVPGSNYNIIRETALQDIDDRWGNLSFELLISSFLDLRFKNLDFLGSEQKPMYEKVFNLLSKQISNTKSKEQVSNSEHHTKLSILLGLDKKEISQPKNELEKYCEEKQIENDENFNVMKWWKENEHNYPTLAKIAQVYVSIPATSAPAERIFSKGGDI